MKQNNNFCQFYILRHGETQWNRQHRIQGQLDSKLTREAIQEAKLKAEELKTVQFDAVFSSDLTRARRTAEIITLDRKMAIETTKLLRERRFGVFEGKNWDEMGQKLRKLIRQLDERADDQIFLDQPELKNVETSQKLVSRFINFLRQTAVAYPQKKVLVVTHGGVMGNFLLKLGFKHANYFHQLKINNLALLVLESDGVEFHIQETKGIYLQDEKSFDGEKL